MGFFKKIGQSIKKASKQISFKNAVRIAGSFDPTGIVSGISAAHEAKKAGREQDAADQVAYTSQKVGLIGGTIAGDMIRQTTQASMPYISKGVNDASGTIGAQVVSNTLKTWFTKNWKYLAYGVGGLVTVFVVLKMVKRSPMKGKKSMF